MEDDIADTEDTYAPVVLINESALCKQCNAKSAPNVKGQHRLVYFLVLD